MLSSWAWGHLGLAMATGGGGVREGDFQEHPVVRAQRGHSRVPMVLRKKGWM